MLEPPVQFNKSVQKRIGCCSLQVIPDQQNRRLLLDLQNGQPPKICLSFHKATLAWEHAAAKCENTKHFTVQLYYKIYIFFQASKYS